VASDELAESQVDGLTFRAEAGQPQCLTDQAIVDLDIAAHAHDDNH
jgi:hypothetical protein